MSFSDAPCRYFLHGVLFIKVEMTEDDWMELLQVCIDLRVTPDTLIECFCWEVIRQQSLLRIVADAIRRDAVTRSAK